MPKIDGELSDEELEQVAGGSGDMKILLERWGKHIKEDVNIKVPALLRPKDDLNSELWDEDKKLRPEVRERLLEIAEKFIKPTLGKDAIIKDITFTGSLANYNYSDMSDIDLHIIIDFADVNADKDIVKRYFNAVKALWNSLHDIRIKGYEVEAYVQDEHEPHTSTGVYSVQDDKWLKEPTPSDAEIDEDSVSNKSNSLIDQIEQALKIMEEGSPEEAMTRAESLMEKIKKLRRAGLESEGEYSVENLAFKTLRNTGYLTKLSDLKREAYDAMMSIEEKKKGKDDRCTRIAKRKYDVWPSAYASGAVVKCRKGKIWKGVSEADVKDTYGSEVVDKNTASRKKGAKAFLQAEEKTDYSKEKKSGLHGWFSRQGGKGKSKGWVDCNTCRKDKKTGKKTCKSCGRKEGEKRAKYPSCRPTPSACGTKGKGKKWGKKSEDMEVKLTLEALKKIIKEEAQNLIPEQEYYEVEALSENEEYCPVCASLEEKKKKACKPSKGKRFAKRVDGKCRSFGQSGQAKSGGDRIRPGTKKGDAYCARSAGIKKCKNPPCANTLSRKKWKCRGKKSVA
tara:strand:+ start:487 stop:2181 length:1695 start_codon:yes stop_codon:yes gene_type:complete